MTKDSESVSAGWPVTDSADDAQRTRRDVKHICDELDAETAAASTPPPPSLAALAGVTRQLSLVTAIYRSQALSINRIAW